MAYDYAKRHGGKAQHPTGLPRWSIIFVGFVSGVFAACLFYLWYFVPAEPLPHISDPASKLATEAKAEPFQWDFYEIFPKNEVPIIEEYTPEGKKLALETEYSYALQAGSFVRQADADRLRARLLLLGLQAFIQRVKHDDTTWHRVLVGPLDSKLALDRTRIRLAAQNIESIQLRMNQ